MIRAALQPYGEVIQPGWDIILLARKPMVNATFQETQMALHSLLNRAKLVKQQDAG